MGLVEFPRPLNTMIRGDISESVNNWTCWKIIIYYRSQFFIIILQYREISFHKRTLFWEKMV